MAGPLAGLRIVELAGMGPGPFACMMLADHGAEVIRIERPSQTAVVPLDASKDIILRSRRVVIADLKTERGRQIAIDLIASADGLVEGFRPGVTERIGLGPDDMLKINPKLVYGRMTGWGQDGPYAQVAGHDINYIALAGALHAYGRAGEKPTPPINMVGDFGGGGMMLAFGMVSALLHAQRTGEGQVIDCAMYDGASVLMSMVWSFVAQGSWRDERGVNLLDTGAHFYDTYETKDGKFISLGSIEPQFYAFLRDKAGLDDPAWDDQMNAAAWEPLRQRLAAVVKARTRDEWCELMEHSDACFAPVLSLAEAPLHPHAIARGTFVEVGGVLQPRPAPRYSQTTNAEPKPWDGAYHTEAVLREIGYDTEKLQRAGVI